VKDRDQVERRCKSSAPVAKCQWIFIVDMGDLSSYAGGKIVW